MQEHQEVNNELLKPIKKESIHNPRLAKKLEELTKKGFFQSNKKKQQMKNK
jgi:hypothetical protein